VRGSHVVWGVPLRLSFIGLAAQAVLSLVTSMLLPRINRKFGPVIVYFGGQVLTMVGLMFALVTGPGPWSIVAALMMAPGYVTHTNNCYIVAFRALAKPRPSNPVLSSHSGYDAISSAASMNSAIADPVTSNVHENKGTVVAAVNMAMPAAQILVGGLAGVVLSAVGDDPARVLFGIGLVGVVINLCVGAIVVPSLSGRVRSHHRRHSSAQIGTSSSF
jgi:Na+/melibiose symporter-like transporter